MNSEQKLKMVIKMMNMAINCDDKHNSDSILVDAICLIGSMKDIKIEVPAIKVMYTLENYKPQINYERTH